MTRYGYWMRRNRRKRRRSLSMSTRNQWGPPVLKTCCLQKTTTVDVGIMASPTTVSCGKYNLHLFLEICIKHWSRWVTEVDHQRQIALARVGREPTTETIDALLGFEKLYPQMLKVTFICCHLVLI